MATMSLIEKAAKRLEELKRAGIEVPALERRPAAGARGAAADETGWAAERAVAVAPADALFHADAPARRSREVTIDLQRLAQVGYVTPDAPRSQLADEFRVIKRPLLDNARGRVAAPIRRANLIMVTSSMPGEGKTFSAINLAMSIAMEIDSRVLLVDADVARPAVLDRLGLASSPGLLDLLTHPDLEMSDVLLKTNVDRLSVLPAGTAHARATELLASDGMSKLLDEIATRYPDRIVIFDAPPLLLSTESRALASQVGQVIMVVEADRTTQNAVSNALAMVESCPVVLTLLNKVDAAQASYGSYAPYGA
jgi:exopolysaccharide/PEP-CTERM locus tyrosine autokinase